MTAELGVGEREGRAYEGVELVCGTERITAAVCVALRGEGVAWTLECEGQGREEEG